MKNLYLAKSDIELKETIQKHTEKLLDELTRLKKIYPNIPNLKWELLSWACKYHDVGKVNTKFQNKLLTVMNKEEMLLEDVIPNIPEIPHGYLSCAFIPYDLLENKDDRKIIAQAVYYHHIRPDVQSDHLGETIKKDLTRYFEDFQQHFQYPLRKPKFDFNKYCSTDRRIRKAENKELALKFIMVKGLLNKIDHAASAGIPVEIKNSGLTKTMDDYFEKVLKSKPNELQNFMKNHQNENIIIIASTGIGKTEAALYWIGDYKGFFTLPLRVSINAIYDRVYHKIGFQDVALLHSDTEREYIKKDLFDNDYYEQTKQWSMPLTISTLDQILDFVFKQEGYEKKLATLAYSKIVIDEIQMYSAKMLACLLFALKEITDIGGKFTIMTATLAPFIIELLQKLQIGINKPSEPFLKTVNGEVMVRHRLKVKNEQLSVEEVLKNNIDKKILVIVNTVKKAQEVYQKLKESRDDVWLFHGNFIKNHRKEKENQILDMGDLTKDKKGIWVTTQIVEASLDLDFDVLYTELSDLNGLFQRMGRVYRNRVLNHERVNIYVYNGGEDYTSGISSDDRFSVIDKSIFQISKEALLNFNHPTIFSEKMKMELIEKVYTTENMKESVYYSDVVEFLDLLKGLREYTSLDGKITNLRDIFNKTIIPYSVYNDNKERIENLIDKYNWFLKNKNVEGARVNRAKIKDELLGYTIDIPKYHVDNAYRLNRHEKQLVLGDYLIIDIVDYDYDSEIGLRYTKEYKPFDEAQIL
ncbi:CRISPR-associated helicase Cas3' [Calidifontibacillus erzurumensis]|uniref:CRISPR-associated helicase Cas3' n=1 Tax=Calidifontibacillus erzurumensis TaxID=2741433 RepID=UPI0035B52E86